MPRELDLASTLIHLFSFIQFITCGRKDGSYCVLWPLMFVSAEEFAPCLVFLRVVFLLNFQEFITVWLFNLPAVSSTGIPSLLLWTVSNCLPDADWAVWSHVDGVRHSRSDPLTSSTSCAILTRSWWWLWDVCWRWPVDSTAGPPPWLSLRLPALPPLPHQAGTRLGDHRPNRGPSLWTRGLHGALLGPIYRVRPLSGRGLRRANCRSTEDVSQWNLPARLYGQSSCSQEPG